MVEYNVGGATFSLNEIPKASTWLECTIPLTPTNKREPPKVASKLRLLKSA